MRYLIVKNFTDYYEKVRKYMRYPNICDEKSFHVLCAAMDILHDTTDAMGAYLRLESLEHKYTGIEYVYIYGILNVLEVQQDALKIIYEIFTHKKLNLNSISELRKIRIMRNDIVGHSLKNKSGEYKGFGIIRHSLSADHVEVMDFSLFGRDSLKYSVKIKDEIIIQLNKVSEILKQIIIFLDSSNKEVKEILCLDDISHNKNIENVYYDLNFGNKDIKLIT